MYLIGKGGGQVPEQMVHAKNPSVVKSDSSHYLVQRDHFFNFTRFSTGGVSNTVMADTKKHQGHMTSDGVYPGWSGTRRRGLTDFSLYQKRWGEI